MTVERQYTLIQLAKKTGRSVRELRRFIERGALRVVRRSRTGKIWIPESAWKEWTQEHDRPGADDTRTTRRRTLRFRAA